MDAYITMGYIGILMLFILGVYYQGYVEYYDRYPKKKKDRDIAIMNLKIALKEYIKEKWRKITNG